MEFDLETHWQFWAFGIWVCWEPGDEGIGAAFGPIHMELRPKRKL